MKNLSQSLGNNVPIVIGTSTETKVSDFDVFIENDIGKINILSTNKEWINGASIKSVKSVDANYSATVEDDVILGTGGGSGITITLPSASSAKNKIFIVKKIDAGTGAVLVSASGGATIDGAASVSLSSQWEKIAIISDGTNWFII